MEKLQTSETLTFLFKRYTFSGYGFSEHGFLGDG